MNKDKLTKLIKYLIDKGVTASDFLDVYLNTNATSEPKKETAHQKKPGRPKKTVSKPTAKSAAVLYTVSEVCSQLNVNPTELKQMIAEGDFPAPDSQGKWSQSSMSRFL